MKIRSTRFITALVVLALVLICSYFTGVSFIGMWKPDLIVKGPGVTQIKKLSDYFPAIKDSAGDTTIYFLEGEEPGGIFMVTGGVHADEPAGWMTAILLVENAVVKKGRLIVIPQANLSGFTHNHPQEGYPQRIHFKSPQGQRLFRFGSRIANPVHYWPDPEVYVHQPSGQHLSGDEVRNLNRGFPGQTSGSFAERVAYAIKQVMLDEGVILQVDLHEAPIEYPFINAVGAHERARELAAMAVFTLQSLGLKYSLELSPPRFHGLTYRELGDFTPALTLLMETANPIQGRLRGITDENLVIQGQDAFYVQAAKLGRSFVPFTDEGWPLKIRIGRHLEGLKAIWSVFSDLNPEKTVIIENIPSLEELKIKGVGYFLQPVP
jgi:hypothetical protein